MGDQSSKFEVVTKRGITPLQELQIIRAIESIVPDHILIRVSPRPIPMKRKLGAIHHLDGNPDNNELSNLRVV